MANAESSKTGETITLALLAAVAVFLAAWAGIELTRETGRIASIWLANAILLAAILKQRRAHWPLFLALGLLANILANFQAGDDSATAMLLSICNSAEVLIAAFVVTSFTRQRDYRHPKPMLLLVGAALGPATIVAAGLAALMLNRLHGADIPSTFVTWYAADALGLITLTPMLLVITWRDLLDLAHPALRWRLALVVLVLVVGLGSVFLQSTMPLLFLAFPAIVTATFALGFTGASLAVLLTSGVALWATVNGLGPISLMQDGLRLQVVALQLFTGTASLTAYAVATLLGERDLLNAALVQAPDFRFIKNVASEFVSVNLAVARHAGFEKPEALSGRTDADLVPPVRATQLRREEFEIMQTGVPMTGKEECIVDDGGVVHWYETSKVALTSRTGRVIGLAGTTREVTSRKTLEASLQQNRDQMALILSEMADGMAVISADGYIVMCNAQYQRLFPISGKYRVPGAFMPQILAFAREQGEQPDQNPAEVMRAMKEGGDEEVRLFNGSWLQARSRPNSNGGCTVLVSDITKIKRAEIELRAMTDQLEILAATDGLTGLPNRRSLDERLEQEIARCKRSRLPISLIMIDIDKFKGFNDLYGHPAGDACLRRVADALQAGAKRPADLVARYGGEEFALVLPETDEAGAFVLAEQLRLAVRALKLEHHGSEKDIVTISAGVASLVHDGQAATAGELTMRADEALYIAKGAGRDRVMGWSARVHGRLPAAG